MKKKVDVCCNVCHEVRSVSYSQAWNIKTGRHNGNCHKCANALNPFTGQKKGAIPWNKDLVGLKGPTHSTETRRLLSEQRKGEKGSNWQGGKNIITESARKGVEYKLWREAVFSRDNYTCQDCSIRGGFLHADHIKPFALFPELRLAIDNGQTLCVPCHRKTPTYGGRIKQMALQL